MDTITFPSKELDSIKYQIERNNFVYTIRVDKEFGRYKLGKTYIAPQLNVKLKVQSIERISSYKQYKYKDELDSDMIDVLKKYNRLEVIKLVRV